MERVLQLKYNFNYNASTSTSRFKKQHLADSQIKTLRSIALRLFTEMRRYV